VARKRPKRLTPLETLIMDCVWELGEASVRDVRERLKPDKPMAYNTVLTMMRILREKGFLCSEREGRMDVYRPLVEREQIGRRSLSEVMERFFSGSAAAVVSQLLESEDVDADELQAIRREVNEKLAAEREAGGG
jgi:predicted transcriptional regulator